MGSTRKNVPASELAPGDWLHDKTMPLGARVVAAREMTDNPDEMFVELSTFHIVDRTRLLSIQRSSLDCHGDGGDDDG